MQVDAALGGSSFGCHILDGRAFIAEDHESFRATVSSFVEREIRPHVDDWDRDGECDRALYKKAGDAGLLGLRYPEALGGSNLDFMATAVLAEELAKSDSIGTAVSLMAQSEFALAILADAASDEIKADWMAPAIAGELIGAIGVSEPGAGSDVAAITTRARRDGGDYIISGQKTFISNGTRADFITLAVRTRPKGHIASCVPNRYARVRSWPPPRQAGQ